MPKNRFDKHACSGVFCGVDMLTKANYVIAVADREFLAIVHARGDCVCFDEIGAREANPMTPSDQLLAELGFSADRQSFAEAEYCIRFKIPLPLAQRIVEHSQFAPLEDAASLKEERAIDCEMEQHFWTQVNPFLISPLPTSGRPTAQKRP